MRHLFLGLTCLLALTSTAATAAPDSKYGDLVIHAGQFSALRNNANKSAEAGIEYRFTDQYYGLRPTIGVLGNTDKAVYGFAGINWDLPLGILPIVITPGTAIGAYSKGDSKRLGSALEFRSSLEATYRFDSGQRFGAAISHLSNAGIGDSNPGTETIQVVYSHPL